jgi:hypothetical protein
MSKHFEDQIVLRIAAPLRAELESAARSDGRTLSGQARHILLNYATDRVLERGRAAGEGLR